MSNELTEAAMLRRGLERLRAGDSSVRGELMNIARDRLTRLTERLRRDFQGLAGAESADRVLQHASLRLYEALHDTPIRDVRHFYQLAAIQIRRELIELCRYGQTLNLAAGDAGEVGQAGEEKPADPSARRPPRISLDELQQWAVLHDSVDALPAPQREVFELVWYHELSRSQVAELLGTSLDEVRRLWRQARLNLHDKLWEHPLETKSPGP
jgi:RNA polymerase sigma-70 factor (ECF subfamily)